MGLKTLKDFTDLLIPLQEAYGQLETEYELQRAMLHGKHAENARLREALDGIKSRCDEYVNAPVYSAGIKGLVDDALEESPYGE